jgi:hypothetical protein
VARILSEAGDELVRDVGVSKAFGRGNAKGLLGRRELPAGEGLLLHDPTGTIHMFFMRFAIDAVFLDGGLRVVKVVHGLKPWRVARGPGAKHILELGAGEATRLGIEPGQRLVIDE